MMFTNVFRIGIQTMSWFQLVPDDVRKTPENEEAFTKQLLAAHIQLQNGGHLSSWTVTQDKGKNVKLWLFVPGRHDGSRPILDLGLKVSKSGVWVCPGNSTEVTAALCQALRNRFERALSAFAYVRFGTMFVKCKRYASDDSDFRKTLPSCEVTFSASEEGVFVHLRVRRRRMRPLSATDVRAVLTHHHTNSTSLVENPAVVVAPYGLTGWLTGCCPGDLVRQLSQSKLDTSTECSIRNSFPQATVRNAGFMSRSWYVEVRMKFLLARGSPSHKQGTGRNQSKTEPNQWIEKVFIFPSESVLVPTVPPISARTYLKRCWLRKFAGTEWLEDSLSLRGFSPLTSLPGYRLQAMGKSNTIWKLNSNTSKSSTSSGSGGSSIKSSDSRGSTGSESDVNDDGEYREDADSAATMAGRGTMSSSTAHASDVDSKRSLGIKRGRDQPNDIHNNQKNLRRTSPEIASSAPNSTMFESNSHGLQPPKGGGSQAGTPWDWNEQVNMQSDADFFAEFGDFGDFFESDRLVFGEPPGTAESQAYMFPFDGDGSATPGTQYMDTSDPMRLPILDFPMLEGLGQEESEKEQDTGVVVDAKGDIESPASMVVPASMSIVAKSEAGLIFATEYAPVEIRVAQEMLQKDPSYRPETKRTISTAQSGCYVYGATPPPTPKSDGYERKSDSRWHSECEDSRKRTEVNELNSSKPKKYHEVSSTDNTMGEKIRSTDTGQSQHSSSFERYKCLAAVLATDLECAMFQLHLHSVKGFAYCAHSDEPVKVPDSSFKECVSEITDSSDAADSLLNRQRDRKKVPERIAGDADDISISHDGPRPVEIGVWRPVGLPKQQKSSDAGLLTSSIASPEIGAPSEYVDTSMQEIVDLIPLLVQQAACCNDIILNGEQGGGALAWLSLQQKLSQQTTMESTTAISDLSDPSVTEVSPATVASILQSDMRQAMQVAFSDMNVAGPLSLADWCRGKVRADSGSHSDISDSKDLVSSITGEPITPPQSTKIVSMQDLDNHTSDFRRGSRETEETTQRRISIDASADAEGQMPSFAMLPVPTVLVGYQEDWLKTSPRSLRYWEKAPLEPYGYAKPVTYYVVCLALDPLLCSALEFFQQLSNVYEACKLGVHVPANVTAQTVNKRVLPGFVTIESSSKLKTSSSCLHMANDYVSAMEAGWDVSEFRKSLRRVCKTLPVSSSVALDADHENTPSTVIYVVSPTSEPSMVLQTLLESCQGLSPNLKKGLAKGTFEDGKQLTQQSITGFSIGRLALQIVTPETIIRLSSMPAAALDVLKELSFAVYNKVRRIPHKYCNAEDPQHFAAASTKSRIGSLSAQGNSSLSGLWKDTRVTGVGLSVLGRDTLLDAGNLRWDKSWSSTRLLETPTSTQTNAAGPQPLRLLYEPLFILADGCLVDHSMGQMARGKAEEAPILQNSGNVFGITDTAASGESESRNSSQPSTFHCCYSWTKNWQWLISVWTDSRGEVLDVNVYPAPRSEKEGGTKELFQLFTQVMQQGQLLLSSVMRASGSKVQSVVVTRIGGFYEVEYQEWQRVLVSNAADEARTWSLVIRPESTDSLATGQQQRSVPGFVGLPTSPGASSSFASRGLLSGYSKSEQSIFCMGKANHSFQWAQNVTLATVSGGDSLQVLSLADSAAGSTWSTTSVTNSSGLATGFGMAKTIASLSGAYLFVPSHGLRHLCSSDFVASSGDLPAFGQWIQSRGAVSPVASGYIISGPTVASRTELTQVSIEEEWPSTLQVGLIAHFGCSMKASSSRQEPNMRLGGNGLCEAGKLGSGSRDQMTEARCILEQLGAEFYGLSWLTISPLYLHRRLPLPFHCDVAQRVDRLLTYADSELSAQR